ncbi:hypothetical protein EXIGLDRAFT_756380 [Exidia glandulosa HHB12029]|uniref:Uncharacterized protein n=1 Tax=Exidia glandulosa HHB12029 TaxID=1314781 RepID=A0A165BB85_EXIGL|nr:hypothetical protein EXIGLDRAFT_756380 [Exidia glandulosa HHB12029]
MPDPNAVLGKRKSIDATGDALVERPLKAPRKWYRPQYVDIATQTDFALAVLEDDAPTRGGMVSVVDAHRLSQPSPPKILVTSAATSSDSPTVRPSPVPRTCVGQPSSVHRTDVAPSTASPKDLAPRLVVSAASATSRTTKNPDNLLPVSAPALAMSSGPQSVAGTDNVGNAATAVPPSSASPPAPAPSISAVATSTLTYSGPNGAHNAPLLAPRLSGSAPASTATSSARAAVSSGLSHPTVPPSRSTDTVPSSVRSGTILATSHASPESLPLADRLEAMGRGSRLRSTRGSWGEGRRYPRLQLATKIAARYSTTSPSPSPEPEEVNDAHGDLADVPMSSAPTPSTNRITATDVVRTTFLSQSSRSATLPPPQGDGQTVPPALASLARLNRLRRVWREFHPDENFDSEAFMRFVNTPPGTRVVPRKQVAMKVARRPPPSASSESGTSEEDSENDLDDGGSQLAESPEPGHQVTGADTSSNHSAADGGEYKLVQVGHHVVRVASRIGVPLGKRLANAVIHSSSISPSPAVSSGRVPTLDGILDRSRSLASLAATLSCSSDSIPTTTLTSGSSNPSTEFKLVQVGNRVVRVPARADSFTSLLKDPSATRVDEPTLTSERPPASNPTTSRPGPQNVSSATGTVSTPRPVQGGKTLPPVQATKKKTRRKNKKKQKQSAAADANGGVPHQT